MSTWDDLLEDRLADAGLLFSGLDEGGRDETVIDAPVGEVIRVISEALLSDESVERAARAFESKWDVMIGNGDADLLTQEAFIGEAMRAALTAAIEGDE